MCPRCEEGINTGNLIVFDEEDETWAHNVCPAELRRTRSAKEMNASEEVVRV